MRVRVYMRVRACMCVRLNIRTQDQRNTGHHRKKPTRIGIFVDNEKSKKVKKNLVVSIFCRTFVVVKRCEQRQNL